MPRYGEGGAVGTSDDWRHYVAPGAAGLTGASMLRSAIKPPVQRVEGKAAEGVARARLELTRAGGKKGAAKLARRNVDVADFAAAQVPKIVARITAKPYRIKRAGVGAALTLGGVAEAARRRKKVTNGQQVG